MAAILKKQRDGVTWRPEWYGVCQVDGKVHVFNTHVLWEGTPPASLRDKGNAAFEASKKRAEDKIAEREGDLRQKGQATHLVERLIELKTGRAVEHVQIDGLEAKVEATRRSPDRSGRPCEGAIACRYFAEFMAKRRAAAKFLYEVTQEDASAFHAWLATEYSPRTACGYTNAVRSAFRRWLPEGASNPFRDVRAVGATIQVHRKPFTPEELKTLLEAARPDALLFPLITACVCTGLRKGDVCQLRWADVDLEEGLVSVRTSKTGEPVEIPLFAPLREVLEARKGRGGKLIFPEAAAMYDGNDTRLTYLFKRLIAQVFGEPAGEEGQELVPAAELAVEGSAAIREHLAPGPRRERVLDSFGRYCEGHGFREIQAATGRVRSTISADLHAVEEWTGKRFLRWSRSDTKTAIAKATREVRERGTRAASVRDWHALRVTFCTLALSAGVPVELVKRITGHKTAEIVMRHYFRPGREAFRAALTGAMPAVLTGEDAERPVNSEQSSVNSGEEPQSRGKDGTTEARRPQRGPRGTQSELVVLAGKVAAGTATEGEKKRFRKMAAGALGRVGGRKQAAQKLP